MPYRKSFPDRVKARRVEALSFNAQGVLINPIPRVNLKKPIGSRSAISPTIHTPPVAPASKKDPNIVGSPVSEPVKIPTPPVAPASRNDTNKLIVKSALVSPPLKGFAFPEDGAGRPRGNVIGPEGETTNYKPVVKQSAPTDEHVSTMDSEIGVVGPAPVPPRLKDFGLSEDAVKRLPKTFFPTGFGPAGSTIGINYNSLYYISYLFYFFQQFLNNFLFLSREMFILMKYRFFLGCTVFGIIPFYIFLIGGCAIENNIRRALDPNYKKYCSFILSLKQFDQTKEAHNREIAAYNLRLEKRQEAYWRSLSGVAFEKEMEKLFTLMGYTVNLTPSTGDGGVDLILQKNQMLTVVQCKAHAARVSIGVARELSASIVDFEADAGIIACFDGVTKPVDEYIKTRRISVLDLNTILVLQRKFG